MALGIFPGREVTVHVRAVPGSRTLVDARPRVRPELEVDVDQFHVGIAVRRLRAIFSSIEFGES